MYQAGKFFADEFVGPIMSCSSEAAGEAAVEADVAAALARALRTTAGTALLRKKRLDKSQESNSASSKTTDSIVGPSRREGRNSDSVADNTRRDNAFGSFKLPDFKWPWQQHEAPPRVITSSALSSQRMSGGDPRAAPDGDVRLRVRPLNEREQAQVGGLVQKLMGQEAGDRRDGIATK